MLPGNIIILNGTSSSGKTSIVRALQEIMEEPYLDAGIDKFLWMLPRRYINDPLYWRQVFEYQWYGEGDQRGYEIKTGSLGFTLVSGMHRAVQSLSVSGNHSIVDHVLLEPDWLAECACLYADLPAWLVGVRCPLEVLEERERQRKDRTLGQARAQFYRVHAHGVYDIEVDTSVNQPMECALQIKEFITGERKPAAFKELRNRQ
jgi:chloramphenicol 3-O phosphotransferase